MGQQGSEWDEGVDGGAVITDKKAHNPIGGLRKAEMAAFWDVKREEFDVTVDKHRNRFVKCLEN